MRLRPEKQPSRFDDSNLIPMINVVFLLLIFFMVAGTFKLNSPVDIADPQSTRSQKAVPERVMHIDSSGNVYIDTRRYSIEDLPSALKTQDWDYSNGQAADSKKIIHLRVDRELPVSKFRQVIAGLRNIGVPEIALITRWVTPNTRAQPGSPAESVSDE